MKKTILIIFILGFNVVSCQISKKEKMIEQFVVDLFDDKIPKGEIVEKYLQIKPDPRNKLSLAERKKGVEGVIQETRKGSSEGAWLIPDYTIKHIKNPKVFPYSKYQDISQIELSGIDSVKENVYVLLDSKKEKILQYFLLNDSGDKIISFSLLIKSKNIGWFFSY